MAVPTRRPTLCFVSALVAMAGALVLLTAPGHAAPVPQDGLSGVPQFTFPTPLPAQERDALLAPLTRKAPTPPATATPPVATTPAPQPPARPVTPGEDTYPKAAMMERALFQRTFPQDDIRVRLTRLEGRLGTPVQPADQMALSDRLDRLEVLYRQATQFSGVPDYSMPQTGADPSRRGGATMDSAFRLMPGLRRSLSSDMLQTIEGLIK